MIDTLEINGLRYRIEFPPADPAKPWCLFLHGFFGTSADFYHITPHITDLVNPLLIDLPGHGETDTPDDPARSDTNKLVKDLAEIIETVTGQPVFLVGYSMGGRLALHFATQRPEMLKALILESTGPGLSDEIQRSERREIDQQRAEAIRSDLNRFIEEWNKMPLFKADTNQRIIKETEHHLQMIQKQQDPEGPAKSLQGFGAGVMPPVSKSDLKKINVPVLLLAGEKDEKYVSVQQKMAEGLKNVEVKIIPGAAHRVHIDAADSYVAELRTFLENRISGKSDRL